MTLYQHFISLARFKKIALAYDFVTTDETGEEIIREAQRIDNKIAVPRYYCATHVLTVPSPDFTAIQELDPYFSDVREVKKLDDFLTLVAAEVSKTSVV